MAYTNNVPQGNQTIASTTDPIRNNFAFIQTDFQVEHSFNGNAAGVAEGVHLRVSMPSQADPAPGTLPTGTSGQIYVSGGVPKFFNGTDFFPLQYTSVFQNVITGTVSLIATGTTSVVTIPDFSFGYYFIRPTSAVGIPATTASAMGMIVSQSDAQLGDVRDPGMAISVSTRTIRAKLDLPAYNGVYRYMLVYFTP